MSVKPKHFRKMIVDTIMDFYGDRFCKPNAVELLMMTAAQETDMGRFFYQELASGNFGIAIGPYQIEPATYDDIFVHYFRGNYPDLRKRPFVDLIDPRYSKIIARGIMPIGRKVCRMLMMFTGWRRIISGGGIPIKGLPPYPRLLTVMCGLQNERKCS